MTAKKSKSKKPAKNHKEEKLSLLEKKLLEFAKKGQPVLLYGKDIHGRKELIRKIHLLNGGIDACWEYEGSEKDINSIANSIANLKKGIRKALKEQNHEKAGNMFYDYNDTMRTYRLVDCDLKSGKKVFNELSCFEFIWYDKRTLGIHNTLVQDEAALDALIEECTINGIYKQPDTRLLIWRDGLLFVDNLRCKHNDHEDDEWYHKLAKEFERRRHDDLTSGNWLVAYAHDPNTFPPYFLDQFELLSLDGEGTVVEPEREEAESEGVQVEKTVAYDWSIDNKGEIFCNGKRITELPPLQFKLFKCLQKRHGKDVKSEVLERCWKNKKPDYVNFLSTEMSKIGSKLKRGLEENNIKIDGDVIERKKENRRNIAYKLVTKS